VNGIDIEHLRQWVGRQRVSEDSLQPFSAQTLASALDKNLSLKTGELLPAGWQWLYFVDPPSAANTGPDGHSQLSDHQKSFLPPTPLPRRMWAAGSLQIERPLRLGYSATRLSTICSVNAKSGKSGSLIFVTLDHQTSQEGRLCLREEQNLVYREMPTAPEPLAFGELAPTEADWSRTVSPDPVLLFRYSALTYNSHRIHYDRDYAVQHEFYPALVVQAPLLAILLLDLVSTNLHDAKIASFQFRAVRPTFDTHAFTVNAKRLGDNLKLWSADHEGNLCMRATARLV
tara:strand:+ start:1524 stop:2384 length:861 start_codon:yes stop_codon:yes gene_type:complete